MSDLFAPAADAAGTVWPVRKADLDARLEALSPAQRAFAQASRFEGGAGQLLLLPEADGAVKTALFGLGAGDDALALAALSTKVPAGVWRLGALPEGVDPTTAAFAWALGRYDFARYKSEGKEPPNARLALPEGADGDAAARLFEGVRLVRDLVNTPANDMGPAELEQAARDLAGAHGAAIEVTTGEDLLAKNLPLIHAVGRASTRAPRLIDFTWGDDAHPKLTLVGKGVCFDTGGLNIKTGDYMTLMKKDMGGAAHVLGLAQLVMASKLPVRLRVLVPAVENAVGGDAFRPGDVIPSRKGLTVEIGNTDAEGRLVLADALAIADAEQPDLIIDFATLTGAARVAMGPQVHPFYTDDDDLAAALSAAGVATHDPLWRLPLWPGYRSYLDSKVADVSHISSVPMGGSITAALFLQRFVTATPRWVHLDVWAWNRDARPGRPVGGEACGLRAVFAVLRSRYGV
jgi:leucyl aminopeptidase